MDQTDLTEQYEREKAKLEGLKQAKRSSAFPFGFRKAIREQKQVVKQLKKQLGDIEG
ncbi:hypothetical protein [Salinithrix halophila]|uniref:50S ribosomal protein L29 n=1 Tax=Salinithrix halophila TaxID=1485204 RepID=A0ABV8JD79_9BACL